MISNFAGQQAEKGRNKKIMQYRIVINLAVCAFSCFVANDLATDIYGEDVRGCFLIY